MRYIITNSIAKDTNHFLQSRTATVCFLLTNMTIDDIKAGKKLDVIQTYFSKKGGKEQIQTGKINYYKNLKPR